MGISSRMVSDQPSLACRSRWHRTAPAYSGEELEDYLSSFALSPSVLVPCSDHWVRALSEAQQGVRERFPSSIPSPDVLRFLLDKGLFAELLQAESIPHPRTVLVGGQDPTGEYDTSDQFFIKPRDSQAFHGRYGVKAFWPDSQDDLKRRLEMVRRDGLEVVLQEYVPGPPSNHYFVDGFVDSSSMVRAIFVRQRLRMYRPRFGNSTYMVSVFPKEAGSAVEVTKLLMEKLRYRGVFSAEFKRDDRDGVFKLLEVNARPWWFVEFAADCGVNVIAMAYRDALGTAVEGVMEYRLGQRLIHPYYDLFACRSQASNMAGALATFLRSVPGARQPVFRWDDPLPGLASAAELTKGFVSRRVQGVFRK
jgi:D-aspartate ligase